MPALTEGWPEILARVGVRLSHGVLLAETLTPFLVRLVKGHAPQIEIRPGQVLPQIGASLSQVQARTQSGGQKTCDFSKYDKPNTIRYHGFFVLPIPICVGFANCDVLQDCDSIAYGFMKDHPKYSYVSEVLCLGPPRPRFNIFRGLVFVKPLFSCLPF